MTINRTTDQFKVLPVKAYRAPALRTYGDLKKLTLTVNTGNQKNDPGNSSQTKT